MLGYLVLLLCALVRPSSEHGVLMTPPSRSTAWRFGFDTPPNYTDNELNCGGFTHQWNNNGGKCGECGDPWDVAVGQRPNQAGGTYATGTIVGAYQQGQLIDIQVDITANHKGWYEFRLCAVNDYTQAVTWSCLNETLLEFEDGTTRYHLPDENKVYDHKLQLPADMTCSQCVLQWLWHCGNNWGLFPNGTECIGCGPQEQFYGCADISISSSGGASTTSTQAPTGDTSPEATTTTPSQTTTMAPTQPPTTTTTTTPSQPPASTTTTAAQGSTVSTTTQPSGGDYTCEYVGNAYEEDDMDAWCNVNCNHTPCYCPSDCQCSPGRPC